MSNQLIKKTNQEVEKVFPKTYIHNITDKSSNKTLAQILNSFNMYFLSYTGNVSATRCLVPMILRKKGLWITYVKYDGNIYTEWYAASDIDDESWGDSSNWRIGNNMLVGDITISANGNWIINGTETEFKAIGEKGNTPLIRIADNKLQVSYDLGDTYSNVTENFIYTQFRFNSQTNTYQISYDLGSTWQDVSNDKVYHQFRTNDNKLQVSTDLGTTWENCSEPIAAWFRWADASGTGNVGKVQISRDNNTWEDLSPTMTNNLYIKGYVATVGDLPTSSAAIGDIYMVGPTYDESDTTHDYPHYRMWVKQSSGWVDNGEFTNAGPVSTINIINGAVTTEKLADSAISPAMTEAIEAETTRAKAAEKANADNTQLNYKDRFTKHTQISPYIKELYIHGEELKGVTLTFKHFFNNNDGKKGFLIQNADSTGVFYTENAVNGYNKIVKSGKVIEIIADFDSVNTTWGNLDKNQDMTILSAAYDINYSPTIKSMADLETVNADLETKVPATEKSSKNLFDKSAIINGYFIVNTSGNLSASTRAAVSPLIPVKPGTVYHLERPCLDTGCPTAVEVRFVEKDGVTPIKPLTEAGVEYNNYSTSRNVTVKAPGNAAYFQCTLKYDGINVDYDKVQFEEGNVFTGYVPFTRVLIADYPNLPSDLDGLSKRVQELEAKSTIEEITIANSDKIGFFSNSFLHGYCMLGKHAINNLSMFSDYIMYNYGHSGDDLLELLTRVNENQSWLGDVPVQNWGIKYGVIAMQDNDGALFAAASDTYYENGKKLANAIKAMGGIPILGTEHDSSNYYYNFTRLSKDFGLMFMDWGLTATRLFKSVFAPFWYNSHPATRTAWMWTYGMKSFLDTLPRPNKSIKIFRVRPDIDTSDYQNLMYEDIVSRAERFEELTCGVSGITEATEKYFDRIDTGNINNQTYKDEYQILQAKSGSVSLGDFALIEVITPYDKNGISNLIVNIASTGIAKVHIKKINAISNPLPSTRYVAFGVTEGAELLTSGSTFEITGGVFNDNLLGTYTVEDVVNNIVVTKTSSSGKTTSGTDNPTTNTVGVTLKGSYDYPSADYMHRYNKPLGEWIEINEFDNGKIDLTSYLATCMDFDKIALLLEGNSIAISDISAVVYGTDKKIAVPSSRKNLVAKRGTSLLAKQLFDSENTEWVGLSDTSIYSPVKSTVSDIYEPLPNGITTVRTMTKGQMLKQQIQTSSIQDLGFSPAVIQIRVIARYFPEYIDTDEKWGNSSIKRGSYDCAKLAIRIARALTDTNSVKVDVINVGAWWNEFIIETPYFSGSYLVIEAEDNNIQIARCDVLQIN